MAAFGANEWLVDEMYEKYQQDPNSVDKVWWDFFGKDQRPTKVSTSSSTGSATSGTNGSGGSGTKVTESTGAPKSRPTQKKAQKQAPKQTPKQAAKAKKLTGKSGVENLRVTDRQAKDIKAGGARATH